MSRSFLVIALIVFLATAYSVSGQTESDDDDKVDLSSLDNSIGLAMEAYMPCEDRFIMMEREIGRPADVENYWSGSFDFKVYKKCPTGDRILLALDNPATISIDSKIGRVNNVYGNIFEFILCKGTPDSVNFMVQGDVHQPFPNIEVVELNGIRVCTKVNKWKPVLLGPANQAVAEPLLPKNFTVPYCGRKILDHTALVTRGVPTKPGDWPWHVALYYYANRRFPNYRCGGSLISSNYVLTAAHCVTSQRRTIPASQLSVVLGKYYLYANNPTAIEVPISVVRVHDDYNTTSQKNDIALLKMSRTVAYTDYIQPICMWNQFNIQKEKIWGLRGTVVGWGTTETDSLSPVLQIGTMAVVSDTTCLLSFPSFFKRFVAETTFCAGNGKTNGTSACNGDSGGGFLIPITLMDGKIAWFLRGVVSISVSRNDRDLCDPYHYIVYTDVAHYLPWIHANTDLPKL